MAFPLPKGLRQGWLKLQATLGSTASPSWRWFGTLAEPLQTGKRTHFYLKDAQDMVRNSHRWNTGLVFMQLAFWEKWAIKAF